MCLRFCQLNDYWVKRHQSLHTYFTVGRYRLRKVTTERPKTMYQYWRTCASELREQKAEERSERKATADTEFSVLLVHAVIDYTNIHRT